MKIMLKSIPKTIEKSIKIHPKTGRISSPRERFWPPPGHAWSDYPHYFDEFKKKVAPDINDFRSPFPYFVNTHAKPSQDQS